ncbi:MFS transporter [Arcanobacterium phocae]|uniref:MFS transporter n=1 Tax=Arcanobacterium phocae TaxID=131112 RepID=UPI001C0F1D3F|nr:MFS transporter [Arcanobacterium phocae]
MKTPSKSRNKTETIPSSAQAKLVTTTVFLAFLGQMLLNPIIAPLSREMGLQEWHIGLTISFAAIVLAVMSSYWGRTSQRLGVKRVIVTGMLIAITSLTVFGILSYLGMNKILAGPGLVIGVMVTRGLIYGAGISAVSPTAQTHLVTHTASEAGRVKATGMIGAAYGMASIVGGIMGGLLAAIGGLMLPLVVMPVVMLSSVVVLIVKFKPQVAAKLIEKPKHIQFRDPRVRPWLISGLLLFIVFSSIATIFGFTVQDRFLLASDATAAVTAVYLTIMGVTMIITQAVIAPKTRWGAAKLFRTGLIVLLLGVACMWPTSSHLLLGIACVLVGLGMGFAMPGYNTGPTLQTSTSEQGAVAGLINANNGIAYAIAPAASTALYGWNPLIPFIISISIVVIIVIYAYVQPTLRK